MKRKNTFRTKAYLKNKKEIKSPLTTPVYKTKRTLVSDEQEEV